MDFDYTTETITPDATTLLTIGGTGALELPEGTTAQQPAGSTAGAMRWNTTVPQLEYYNGSTWLSFGGSVTSVSGSGGATGLTLTGGPITTTGTLTLGGTLGVGSGGTGSTSTPTNGQILVGNGTNFVVATLGTGTGISTTVGAGTLQINNTGVTSIVAGTAISISGATGAVTVNNTGVTSLSFGTTGLTPNTATTGAITVAGTLIVGNGGTGATTLTAHGVLLGQGTSAITATAVGATGTVLSGNTGADPTFTNTPAISGANFTAASIPNSALANSSITIGTTTVSLGGTSTTLAGMTGITFTSGTVTGVANPVAATDVVNLSYLQTVLAGLEWKQEAVAASTANLTVTYNNGASGVGATLTNAGAQAAFAIDGYTPNVGDRILIKNQTTQTQNGIYTLTNAGSGSTNWVLTRAIDNNTPSSMDNATLFVTNGTANINTAWTQTTPNPTIGTNNIVFVQNSGAGTYTAGTGLTLTGNVFSLTSPVVPTLGGTGTTTAPSAGQILIGTSGAVYTPATLTAGTAISITSASGSITINNTGVTSWAGGTTGLTPAAATTGAVTLAGTLIVGNGGTGVTTFTSNGVLYGNAAGNLQVTAAGTTGQVLVATTAAAPSWSTLSTIAVTSITGTANQITASAATGAVTLSTPATFIAPGSIQATTTLTVNGLTILSESGTVAAAGSTQATATALTSTTNVVTTSTTGTAIGVALPTGVAGEIINVINKSANTINIYPANGSGASIDGAAANAAVTLPTNGTVSFVARSATQWDTYNPNMVAGTGVSVTYGNGNTTIANTGVTTWAGGTTGLTPAGATAGAVTLAGTLIVGNGGTGATTLTQNGVLFGNGTSAVGITAAGTTGQVLVATTGSAPTWSTLTGIAVTTFQTSLSGLTPNTATSGAITLAGTLNPASGGTGITTIPTNGQLLIGNGTNYTAATLTAGANITITNGAGTITVAGPQLYKENPSSPVAQTTSGTNAVAIGSGNTAAGTSSLSTGLQANARLYGQVAQASGQIGALGDAQNSKYMLRIQTTNATPAVAFLDGSAARLTLPASTSFLFDADIVCIQTTASATPVSAAWNIKGLILQGSTGVGSTAIQGNTSTTFIAKSTGTTLAKGSVTATADVTNGALQFNVTGLAATTLNWVVTCRTTEVGAT